MIKLLLISNRYPAHADDAASPFVSDFVKGLNRHDIETTVLTPYHFSEKYDNTENIVRFKWGEENQTIGSLSKYSPLSWLKIANYLYRGNNTAQQLHQTNKFDFCLALWAAPSGIFARNLKKKYDLDYAVWCLGSDIHTYPKIPVIRGQIISVLKQAERIYSDGYELGERASELCGKESFFLPSMRKVNYPPSKHEKREKLIVCPGRVEEAKGVYDLLEAFKIVSSEFPEWQLYFIGDGSARSELENRIEKYGLSNRVKSLGFVPRENMYRAIVKSSAVVIPTHADSLPLTFGEAMQLNHPVIATDVGDLRYFIEKYQVGTVVPAQSPEKLAEALRLFITNGTPVKQRFDECVNELNIDRAADSFADWLISYLSKDSVRRESVAC
ncbi:MAG: glycosyltransferase [candidate division Zixibacteria bacterium]|nr:glycosyltransferase [candidate division Zixibacteria bacterium]